MHPHRRLPAHALLLRGRHLRARGRRPGGRHVHRHRQLRARRGVRARDARALRHLPRAPRHRGHAARRGHRFRRRRDTGHRARPRRRMHGRARLPRRPGVLGADPHLPARRARPGPAHGVAGRDLRRGHARPAGPRRRQCPGARVLRSARDGRHPASRLLPPALPERHPPRRHHWAHQPHRLPPPGDRPPRLRPDRPVRPCRRARPRRLRHQPARLLPLLRHARLRHPAPRRDDPAHRPHRRRAEQLHRFRRQLRPHPLPLPELPDGHLGHEDAARAHLRGPAHHRHPRPHGPRSGARRGLRPAARRHATHRRAPCPRLDRLRAPARVPHRAPHRPVHDPERGPP